MKVFDIQYKDQKVVDAYSIASEILLSQDLKERVLDVKQFTYTNDGSFRVSQVLGQAQSDISSGKLKPIRVKSYWYRNDDVIATTGLNEDPEAIFINSNALPYQDIQSLIQNGAHEFGHVPMGYRHGTNFPAGSWRGRMLGDWQDKNLAVNQTLERLVWQLALEKGMVKK